MLEPILVEDSTITKLVPSLEGILKDLNEYATFHDYFVALLIVFLAESGFYESSTDRSDLQWCVIVFDYVCILQSFVQFLLFVFMFF